MRKSFLKKVCVVAMATVMTVTSAMSAFAAEYTAKFSLADADWSYQVWGDKEGSTATITGAGSYSMTLSPYEAEAEDGTMSTVTADGATVFVIDIEIGKDVLAAQNYRVTDLKLTVDGAAFTIDTSKIVTGDIEDKGNLRIELFNAYGPTAVNQQYDASTSPFDPATLKSTESIKVDFTLAETDEPAYDADGKSIKYTGLYTAPAVDDTTDNTTNDTTTNDTTNDTTTDNTANNNTTTPDTGDSSMVAMYLVVALAAAAVVLKKRTATN